MKAKGLLFSLSCAAMLNGCANIEDLFNVASCDNIESQQQMLDLVNEARATARYCGMTYYEATTALARNDLLENAAQSHADDMATNNFFSHTGSDGLGVADRVQNAGYDSTAVGENIGAGYTSATSAMNGWLTSAGHCENIMNPNYQDFGMACAENDGSDYDVYWVQVFGRK
jgi:uncharacterized protein YkwD